MPDAPSPGRKRLNRVAGPAAAVILLALVGGWEGKRNDPYKDIVGVWTVCYGETRVAMRRYTNAECSDMLANGIADFAGPVLDRNPELAGHPHQLAAATSLAYNIGMANYGRSSTSRLFRAGRWKDACSAILRWNRAGGRVVNGLSRRREAERRVCMTGL